MAWDKHGPMEGGTTHPTLVALERAVALARDTRATLAARLREAELYEGSADVTWLRRALLNADRRMKRVGGALSRESRRLARVAPVEGDPSNHPVP
jgi:hypothetical protein